MKKLLILAAYAAIATTFALSAKGQTNAPAPSFFTTGEKYFTEFNTNYTWQGISISVATGYKQITGVGASSTIDGAYQFGATQRWNAGLELQFSGVGSAFNSYEAQVGYELIQHYDAVLEFDLRGGWDDTHSSAVIEPAVFIKKKLTENTYAEIGASLPVFFKGAFNQDPTLFVESGFTY